MNFPDGASFRTALVALFKLVQAMKKFIRKTQNKTLQAETIAIQIINSCKNTIEFLMTETLMFCHFNETQSCFHKLINT